MDTYYTESLENKTQLMMGMSNRIQLQNTYTYKGIMDHQPYQIKENRFSFFSSLGLSYTIFSTPTTQINK